MYRLQCLSWLASVLWQVLPNGQHSTALWNNQKAIRIRKAIRASRLHIDEAKERRICCGFGLGQPLISTIDVWHTYAVQQVADLVEVKDAEDHGSRDCGGRVMLSMDGCHGGPVPPIPPGRVIRPEEAYTDIQGQLRVYRKGQRRYWRTRVGQAHRHSEALRSRGHPEWSDAACRGSGPRWRA
jgi:hypothetical protein